MYEKPVVSCDSTVNVSARGGSVGRDTIQHVEPIEPVDRAAEKRLLRKCDLHVIPVVTLLYSLAFLDRINIGNARLQGLEKDLHMKGQDSTLLSWSFSFPTSSLKYRATSSSGRSRRRHG